MRGRLILGVAVAGLVLGLLASCSDDDTTGSDATGSDATAPDPGSTEPDRPTTTEDGDTSTTVDVAALSVPVAHDEDGGTDGDVLLDGQHFGYITTFIAGHNEIVGELDLAEVYFGEEAEQAMLEDTPDVFETGRDFYVRNRSAKLRPIQVDPEAVVYEVPYGTEECCGLVETTVAQWAADRDANGDQSTPVNITIVGGIVTEIVEIYFP